MITIATPWGQSVEDKRFHRNVSVAVGFGLFFAFVVSEIRLPIPLEVEREPRVSIAEIILPPPEPIKPPVVERVKKPIKKEVKKPPPLVKEPPKALVAEAPQTVRQAKEKARASGILAFQDQLQAMRDEVDETSLKDTATLTRGSGQAAELKRSVITSAGPSTRQATVKTSNLSQETGGIALAGRETTIVEAVPEEVGETGAMRLIKPTISGVRSIEEVRRVFDANKGAIFSIYNRALRKDPTLLGKIVLELVIEPDGTVSACEVLTSELQSEELITRVVRRVQLFDFGEKDVAATKISYPVHFLPT